MTNGTTRRGTARIAFGSVELLSPPIDDGGASPITDRYARALRESLVPGTSATRYNREWRMGQWREVSGAVLGRIGFEAVGGVAEVWDDAANDFREQRLPAGTTAPFAVELISNRVAFQIRPGVIERGTFTGALQALLNTTSDVTRWRVSPEVYEVPWDRFVAEVERIVRLDVRLDRPNPNYHGRENVEELIEGTAARMLRMIWEAPEDDLGGIAIDDDFIIEAIEHAREYGDYRAIGEAVVGGERRRVQWRSEAEGVRPERRVSADPVTREAKFEEMRRELREHEGGPGSGRNDG